MKLSKKNYHSWPEAEKNAQALGALERKFPKYESIIMNIIFVEHCTYHPQEGTKRRIGEKFKHKKGFGNKRRMEAALSSLKSKGYLKFESLKKNQSIKQKTYTLTRKGFEHFFAANCSAYERPAQP